MMQVPTQHIAAGEPIWQDLSKFRQPETFRGRPAWIVQLWWIVQATLFGCSPQFLYAWRRFLLRLFGARLGTHVMIRPTARITYPWKVTIGDHAWVGDHAALYSLAEIEIGRHAVVSQRSYLCTGSHRVDRIDFEIYALPIKIHDEAWIASDVFIAPGVTIGAGAVIGARSSVFSDIESAKIAVGSPARVIAERKKKLLF